MFSLRGRFPPSSLATAKAKYSVCSTTPFSTDAYGTFTLYHVAFQPTSATARLGCKRYKHTPHLYCITAAIQFGLCRFRSPLLTVSQLISFPLATQMFPFAEVHVPQREQEKPEGSSYEVAFGHPRISGFVLLPEAYRSLTRPSSSSKPSHPPNSVSASDDYIIDERIRNLCTTIITSGTDACYVLQSSFNVRICISNLACALAFFAESNSHPQSLLFSKEVIRPQVPLRPPCYDFSPVAELRFDSANKTPPRPSPTSVKRRAVCARSRDVFTARW